MIYRILYRGPLSSCNYACSYCPFAKRAETNAELAGDRAALKRFVDWVATQPSQRLGIFFTPWGEALIRPWYQRALIALTHLNLVERAVIQTNLSCGLDWVNDCRLDRLALWTTFHPGEMDRAAFVGKVRTLHDRGVRLSVGVVGLREHFDAIAHLRAELPEGIYVWINAYKRLAGYYAPEELAALTAVDPFFPVNTQRHASLGEVCGAGETSFTVDGEGTMRRCHFVSEPIGSIYDAAWRDALRPRRCPNSTCSCHVGYVHVQRLRLQEVYGENILERIPLQWPALNPVGDTGGTP